MAAVKISELPQSNTVNTSVDRVLLLQTSANGVQQLVTVPVSALGANT